MKNFLPVKCLLFLPILLLFLLLYPTPAKAQTLSPTTTFYCIGGNQGPGCTTTHATGGPGITIATPITIVPTPTCSPRPACLTATPRCLPAEPQGGWCPDPTPSCILPSANFMFILDVSQSMAQKSGALSKIQYAEIAMTSFVDLLDVIPQPKNIQAGLVTFSGKANVDQPLTSNFQSLNAAIKEAAGDLAPETCTQCGIDASEQQVANNQISGKKIAILVSDGEANWTETSKSYNAKLGKQAAIKAAIAAHKASGMIFYTVGVGTPGKNADFGFMKQIANATGGKFYNVPVANQLLQTYMQIAADTKPPATQATGLDVSFCKPTVTPSISPSVSPSVSPTPPPCTVSASTNVTSKQIKQHIPIKQGFLQELIQALLQILGVNNIQSVLTQRPPCPTPTPTPPSPTLVCPTPKPVPTDFLLTLDVSDSMKDKSGTQTKIAAAVSAMDNFIGTISQNPANRVSFVTFAQTGQLQNKLTNNYQAIKNSITNASKKLSFRTCTQCGIDVAKGEEIEDGIIGKKRVAVLATDGEANWTETMVPPASLSATLGKKAALQAAVNAYKTAAITFDTIGVGTPGKNADFAFLKQIAQKTGGKFYYAKNADQLNSIYQQIALLRNQTASSNNTITSSCAPTPTCAPPPSCLRNGVLICMMPRDGWCHPTPTCTPRPFISCPRNAMCLPPNQPPGGWCTVTPSPTCIPRPACLTATPRCLLVEPAQGWCPPNPTPTCTPRPFCKPGFCILPVPPPGGWCKAVPTQ